jgi:hypothetical protein
MAGGNPYLMQPLYGVTIERHECFRAHCHSGTRYDAIGKVTAGIEQPQSCGNRRPVNNDVCSENERPDRLCNSIPW